MSSPRLALFDIDGTLVDTAGAGRRAIRRAFAAASGRAADEVERALAPVRFAGRTDPTIFADVAGALRVADWAALASGVEAAYYEALADEMATADPGRRVLPGVLRLLERLHGEDGVDLGLLTGNFERGARIKLEPFGLNPPFPAGGFGSDAADRREVARVAVRAVAARTGRTYAPQDVVVIGDTEHDVDCALANGFGIVAVDCGWGRRETMEAMGPDLMLPDLGDTDLVFEFLVAGARARGGRAR